MFKSGLQKGSLPVAGLKKLSYGQRLKLVNLPRIELRRLHTDLWCYKIVFGAVDLMCDDCCVHALLHVATCTSCTNPVVPAPLGAFSLRVE